MSTYLKPSTTTLKSNVLYASGDFHRTNESTNESSLFQHTSKSSNIGHKQQFTHSSPDLKTCQNNSHSEQRDHTNYTTSTEC